MLKTAIKAFVLALGLFLWHIDTLQSQNPPKAVLAISTAQYKCLIYNTLFEAGNQPLKGMIAVNYVVMNRTDGTDYCKTVFAKNQFSWTNNKHLMSDFVHGRIPQWAMNEYAKVVMAINVTLTHSVSDPTDGATFYHTLQSHPYWSKDMVKTTVIADHVFYRM